MQIFLTELWHTLWLTTARKKKMLAVFAAVVVSAIIGYRFADNPFISINPVLLWFFCIFLCAAALYPAEKTPLFHLRLNRTWAGLFALLVAAFLLRVFKLTHFPSGFIPDEAGSMNFALQYIFNPNTFWIIMNPLRTGLDSQPVLYSYILRLSVQLFGFTIPGARMSSAIIGALSIGAVFLMVNEMADRKTAWLTAILMTAYHYHIHWSRVSLSNIWVTLLLPLTVGFFLRGWRKGQSGGALLAGFCLGATAYFYTGGYVLVFLVILLLWQTWKKTSDHVRLTIYAGRMLAFALVIAIPLIVFSAVKPEHFFDRLNTIYGWKSAAVTATLGNTASYSEYLIHQVVHSFGAYNFFTDVTGFYAPKIPFLIGVSSLLFPIGIGLAFYRKQYFPILWVFLVTMLGGVLIVGTPASSHFIASIPAVCWLVAIPIHWASETKYSRWATIALVVIIITDLVFYFGVYSAGKYGDFTVPFPSVEPYIH